MRSALTLLCVLVSIVAASCVDSESESARLTDPLEVEASSDGRPDRPLSSRTRTVRLTGTLEAVRSTRVVVPQLSGPSRTLTLIRLVPNGAVVEAGDIVATFDAITQVDQARQSAARFDDLSYRVRQKVADNQAAIERRRSAIEQAQADLAKALLEVSKAEVLSRVEAEENEIRAEKAQAQLDSLRRKHVDEEIVDQAALRLLELQRDRARANFDTAQANLEKLEVRAPLSGMVALYTRYNSSSIEQPQEGDQMNARNSLLSIFDPGEMRVRVAVPEPDGALLYPGLEATVYIDAYPDLALPARFQSASPIAAGGLGTPLRSFGAIFRLEDADPRLMPDLSAAVVFEAGDASGPGGARSEAAVRGREAP
jgi:HlyD family secretion protein